MSIVAKQMTSNMFFAMCDVVQMCFVGVAAVAGSAVLFTH